MGQSKFSVIPLILSNNLFISDSLDKAKIFNTFYANQCTNTASTLPDTPTSAPPYSISNVNISESKIKDFLKRSGVNGQPK